MNMTIDVFLFIAVMITVVGIVLWDMNKDKEND
jgi:hypothetical protein